MTALYLAGPYTARDVLARHRTEAEQHGHKVYARWLDGNHEIATNREYEQAAAPADRARWAREDLADIDTADALVAFTIEAAGRGGGKSGGRHIEMGYALARRKRVILVGRPENVFHWLPSVELVTDWPAALALLDGPKVGPPLKLHAPLGASTA